MVTMSYLKDLVCLSWGLHGGPPWSLLASLEGNVNPGCCPQGQTAQVPDALSGPWEPGLAWGDSIMEGLVHSGKASPNDSQIEA